MNVKATYTLMEVARLTGRPKSTVYKWADTGQLVTVTVGTQRLVPLAALQKHYLVWKSIEMAADLAAATRSPRT